MKQLQRNAKHQNQSAQNRDEEINLEANEKTHKKCVGEIFKNIFSKKKKKKSVVFNLM